VVKRGRICNIVVLCVCSLNEDLPSEIDRIKKYYCYDEWISRVGSLILW